MKFEVVVIHNAGQRTTHQGRVDLKPESITGIEEQKIIETEQFLERLTGLRFHINPVQ